MARVKGFALLEMMLALAIGLSLLSVILIIWIALSKNTHKEIKQYEAGQDYVEVVSYIRQVFGQAIFHPHCPNIEWLKYKKTVESSSIERLVRGLETPVAIYDYSSQSSGQQPVIIGELVGQQDKLVLGANIIEYSSLTPLQVADQSRIMNVEDIKGVREGYVLATDCQGYVIGQYGRNQKNESVLLQPLVDDVGNYLNAQGAIQFYKINRELLYLVNENGQNQLVHNFLNGSNYIRLYGVEGFLVQFIDPEDRQLLLFQLGQEPFYVRLYNL